RHHQRKRPPRFRTRGWSASSPQGGMTVKGSALSPEQPPPEVGSVLISFSSTLLGCSPSAHLSAKATIFPACGKGPPTCFAFASLLFGFWSLNGHQPLRPHWFLLFDSFTWCAIPTLTALS